MPQNMHPTTPDHSYTPEFKLQVVLAYIRAPRSKKRICKENKISEELLEQWHQEFLGKATQAFTDATPGSPSQPTVKAITSNGETPIGTQAPPPVSSWGIRFNYGWQQAHHSPSSSREQPAWLRGFDVDHWNQRGVVVWDDAGQKMEFLYAGQALELLQNLRQTTDWQTEGIRLPQDLLRKISPENPSQKQKQEKAALEESVDQANQSEYEEIEQERLRLTPQAGAEVFAFLEKHEDQLKEMAAGDEKHIQDVIRQYWTTMFGQGRDQESKEIDLSKRALPWVYHPDTHTWTCDVPPNRATILLGDWNWYWISYIEQPDHFKHESPICVDLAEAMGWAEQQLLAIQKAETETVEPPIVEPSPKPRMDLTPYWIEPAALEPERITYRVVIFLEREPESFQTWEPSFGKRQRYGEEYKSPVRVAEELKVAPAQATVEWPGGLESSHYIIYSTAMYFQENIAIIQAQQLWDQSEIQRLYRAGIIKEARYGYKEVETGYCVWLGGLPNPERPWPKQKTRAEYMEDRALRETIAYALDMDRFREDLGASSEWIMDERLLQALHTRRARSKHIPAAARAESEQWLREHPKETDSD